MSNFKKRAITGISFVGILIGCIWLHPISFFVLWAIIISLGLLEYYRLIDATPIKANKSLGFLLGLVFFSISCLYAIGYLPAISYWALVPFVSSIFISELYRKQEHPFSNIAITIFGVLYVVLPLSFLVLSGFPKHTMQGYTANFVLGYFFLLWASDTGAYLTGITIGKHPMFPRISPKKSWEGFIGGIIFTQIVAFIIAQYFTGLSLMDWLIIAGIITIFGVWGDLIESMLKRSLQIKDSGTILPGHGGILDRFDSVLFSAPMVFVYLQIKEYLASIS